MDWTGNGESSLGEDEEDEEEFTSHPLDDHHRITHPANVMGLILTISSSYFLPFYGLLPL